MQSTGARTVVIILISIFLAGCSTSTTELSETINEQLKVNSEKHGIPAQALMIMHNQAVMFRNNLGINDVNSAKPISNEAVFPIYSITKLFASTIVMQLHEEGRLELSDYVSKYVDNLPINWQKIRVQQLLNHTSGLPEYYNCKNKECKFPVSFETAISRIRNAPMLFEPDAQMQYNQTNYLLLKSVIESVTETSYRKLVYSRIFKPLNLQNTWLGLESVPKQRLVTAYHSNSGSTLQENEATFPDYSISHADAYSTLGDLSKFLSAIAQGHLISKQSLMGYWQPYRLSNGDEGYFASGWDYNKAGNWQELGHDGGGLVRVRILFQENLDDHYVIVYLTNGNKDGVWSRNLVDSVQYLVMPDLFSRIVMRW
ncbi:beta-lactamase family protein [Alteromonas sp. ASW11-19]|uniref:Beta-lactamase family protein n=1 Tax=Alteromonas salexigens TaxID=2982530 RepID=A0ABT2VRM5_9ALTE|nr:serine hydrolase domain-containing protein [Alteromonas salexigens]MCU7555965.1 beta-lactamase family protein [Alteromonas salexigens]